MVKKVLNLKPPISLTNNDFNAQISKFRMAQLPARLAGRVVLSRSLAGQEYHCDLPSQHFQYLWINKIGLLLHYNSPQKQLHPALP